MGYGFPVAGARAVAAAGRGWGSSYAVSAGRHSRVRVGTRCSPPAVRGGPVAIRLGTFFDIQNQLLLLTSKIQTGYWFFHHIKNRLLVWTYVSKQVPVIDNLGVQLSVVQVVWTIQNHVTIYDLIANTGCLAKRQNRLLACVQKMKPFIGFKQPS